MATSAFVASLHAPFRRVRHGMFATPGLSPRQCRAPRALPSASLLVEAEVLPRLRALSADTRRGRRAAENQLAEAETLVSRLEDVPAPPPLLAQSVGTLEGTWHLIFLISGAKRRSSPSLQSATIRAADNDPRSRNVTQTISVRDMRAVNSSSFAVLGVPCAVSVDAKLNAIDSHTLEVKFQRALFKFGFLPAISFPIRIFNPRGTLRTTYLSETCRIGRGDKGSLFVLVKEL